MENFLHRDRDRRVVRVDLHDVGHHIPPLLGNRVDIGSILAISLLAALLIGKEEIRLLVPEDRVVGDALLLDHLDEFWPNSSVPLLVFDLAAWLQFHLERESFHNLRLKLCVGKWYKVNKKSGENTRMEAHN